MRFTTTLGELQRAVATAAKGAAASGIRPALANVLIRAHDDEVTVVGTDLEISLVTRISAVIEESGAVAAPAKLLQEILGSMAADKDEKIELHHDEDLVNLRVRCVSCKATLPTFDPDDIPPVIDMTRPAPTLGLPPEFSDILATASVAIGANDNNPAIGGLLMEISADGQITLVSTDQRRLATDKLKLTSATKELVGQHIVPARAVVELSRILSDETGTMMELRDGQLVFTTPAAVLVTRLIDAKYPDYRRIMPKDAARTMRTHRKDLVQSLRAVAPISARSGQMVRFEVKPQLAVISATAQEDGSTENILPCILEGEPINIAFNAKYLLDFLAATDADEIEIAMTTPSHPGVMRPIEDGSEFRYVIMPMTA